MSFWYQALIRLSTCTMSQSPESPSACYVYNICIIAPASGHLGAKNSRMEH